MKNHKTNKFLIQVPNLEARIVSAHMACLEKGIDAGRKITVARIMTPFGWETSLTPYGRERAKYCEGGYNGCSGEVKSRSFDNYKAPQCNSCYQMRNTPNVACSLCGISFKKGTGHSPLPLMRDTKSNKVCDVCNLFILHLRSGFAKGKENE